MYLFSQRVSKLFKPGLWIKNFQMYKLDFESTEEPKIKWPGYFRSKRKQGNSRKKSTSASLTALMPLNVWVTTNCGKFLKRWEYQTTILPDSWEACIQVKRQQLEQYMEQQNSSILGNEYSKFVYCHPAYLTSVQSASWEIPSWMNHKLELRLPGEISTTSDMQMIPL